MKTKNLGPVQAIFTGINPPVNKKMLWYDEGNKVFKYYNFDNSAWSNLAGGAITETDPIYTADKSKIPFKDTSNVYTESNKFEGGILTDFSNQVFGNYAARESVGADISIFGSYAAWKNKGDYLCAFGFYAASNNDGNGCSAFGFNALKDNAASSCEGFGANVLQNNTGARCSALGGSAMLNNKGDDNVAIGHSALQNTMEASQHLTAIGYSAASNSTPIPFMNSTCIGANSQITKSNQVTLGDGNTEEVLSSGKYIGKNLRVTNGDFDNNGFDLPISRGTTGQFLKLGANGVCEWADAGGPVGDYVPIAGNDGNPMTGPLYYDYLVGKNFNEAVGVDALTNRANPGVTRNTAIGGYSLYALTVGEKNVSVGDQSAMVITSGNRNTFIGSDPNNFTQGNDNVFIGSSTPLITGGNYNVFINSRASSSSWGTHNLNRVIAIGNFTHEITEDNTISIGDGDSVIKGKSGHLNSDGNFIKINGEFAVKDWNFKQVAAGLNIYHSGTFKARIGTDGNLYLAGTKVEYNAAE